MVRYADESEIFYSSQNEKLRKNFLKYTLTEFDNFHKTDTYEIINWLLSGKFGYEPYTEFYEEYTFLKDDNKLDVKINMIIDSLENSNSLSQACEKCNIPLYKANIWLELGKNDETPFDIFYNYYKSFSKLKLEEKINSFINNFDGFNEIDACNSSDISQIQLASWLRLNKLGGIFKRLYDYYLKIVTDTDYSKFLDFNETNKFSRNTMDMLFALSDVGETYYNDFFMDYNLMFPDHNNVTINYPESYIEQFLDSFHNYHKLRSLKLLNRESVYTCDVLDLVESKKSNHKFYKDNHIDEFLNYIVLGYDEFDASKLSNISYSLINNWLDNGIQELNYDTFFEDYNSALILNNYLDFINDKLNYFISYLNEGKSLKEICKLLVISFRDIELYLNLGYLGYTPYTVFYQEFEKVLKNEFYKENDLNVFLTEIKNGKFKSQAVRKSKIKVKEVNEFIKKGNEGLNKYKSFLTDYKIALINNYYSNKDSKVKIFLDELNNGKSDGDALKISKIPLEVFEFWISVNILKDFKINYFKTQDSKFFSSVAIRAREKFLDNLYKGFDKSDACKNLPFSENEVNIWLEKGKLNEEPYIEFYRDYQKVYNGYFNNEMIYMRKIFLKSIEQGLTKSQAIKQNKLSSNEIKDWLNLGENGVEPYNEFYSEYVEANEIGYFNELNTQTRKTFLNAIEEGYSTDATIKKYGLQSSKIKEWLNEGRKGIKPYDEFYYEFYEAKNFSYFNDFNKEIRNIFLNSIEKGFSQSEAIKKNNLPEGKIDNWLLLGSKDIKPYVEFYNDFNDSRVISFYKNYNIDLFLREMQSESLKNEALEKIHMSNEEFNEYYEKGKNPNGIYHKFYLDYNESLKIFFNSEPESKREIFINDFTNGLSFEESLNNAGLSKNYVCKCIELKDYAKFFKTFYKKFQKAESNGYYFRVSDNKNKFFELIENGETIDEASKIAGLNKNNVKKWIAVGKKGISKDHEFFDNYLKAAIKFYCLDENISKRKDFIKFISRGVSKKESYDKSNLNIEHVNQWFSLAKRKIKPFTDFNQEYEQALIDSFNSNTKKQDKILKLIEKDQVLIDACKKVNLDAVLVRSWLTNGKKGKQPYIEFYNKYNQSLINQLNNHDSKLDEFFYLISNGETIKGACKILKLKQKMVNNWISSGRNGNEIYAEFYERYDEIRNKK